MVCFPQKRLVIFQGVSLARLYSLCFIDHRQSCSSSFSTCITVWKLENCPNQLWSAFHNAFSHRWKKEQYPRPFEPLLMLSNMWMALLYVTAVRNWWANVQCHYDSEDKRHPLSSMSSFSCPELMSAVLVWRVTDFKGIESIWSTVLVRQCWWFKPFVGDRYAEILLTLPSCVGEVCGKKEKSCRSGYERSVIIWFGLCRDMVAIKAQSSCKMLSLNCQRIQFTSHHWHKKKSKQGHVSLKQKPRKVKKPHQLHL